MVNDARGLGELANPSVRMSIVVTVRSFDGLDLPIQTDLDPQIKMESPQLGSAPSREDNEETTEFPRKNRDKRENRGFDNSCNGQTDVRHSQLFPARLGLPNPSLDP